MLQKRTCPMCLGSGVRMVETSKLFGLLKRNVPATCEGCRGQGTYYETQPCEICEGQGLVGNESESCRACNGTGKADTFAFIPRRLLTPGTLFARRCESCPATQLEIVSEIEDFTIMKSWESEEELREKEIVNRVKVRCPECSHSYYIRLNPEWNQEIPEDQHQVLENLGFNLSFLYDS